MTTKTLELIIEVVGETGRFGTGHDPQGDAPRSSNTQTGGDATPGLSGGRSPQDIEASPWIRRFGYSTIPARPQPYSKDSTPPTPQFRAASASSQKGSGRSGMRWYASRSEWT